MTSGHDLASAALRRAEQYVRASVGELTELAGGNKQDLFDAIEEVNSDLVLHRHKGVLYPQSVSRTALESLRTALDPLLSPNPELEAAFAGHIDIELALPSSISPDVTEKIVLEVVKSAFSVEARGVRQVFKGPNFALFEVQCKDNAKRRAHVVYQAT